MKKITAEALSNNYLDTKRTTVVDILAEYENNLKDMDLHKDIPELRKPITRKFTVDEIGNFKVFSLDGRADAFNFEDVKDCLLDLANKYPQGLVIDLEKTDFLSIAFIKLLAQIAEGVRLNGGGLALLAPSEKIKRQIDIFASLEEMVVFRSKQDILAK